MKKVSIIGAGNVGSTAGFILALKAISDVVLIDIDDSYTKGKALDIQHALPLFGSNSKVTGGNDYVLTRDSDIIVITAGFPRKPGMTRDDLLSKNADIVISAAGKAAKLSPNAVIIVVTNPLDVMAYAAMKASGFDKKRVIGMAGVLDSARFRAHLAEAASADVRHINALVLGTHGDTMVPVASQTFMNSKQVDKFIDKATLDRIIERVRNSGGEIVGLLKTGSAYVAPAASVAEMAEAVLKGMNKLLPCSCYLEGEYGIKGIFLGVPAVLGTGGIQEIMELRLSKDEALGIEKGAANVREETAKVEAMLTGK